MLDWISSKLGLKAVSADTPLGPHHDRSPRTRPREASRRRRPEKPAQLLPAHKPPPEMEMTLSEEVLQLGRVVLLGKADEVLQELPLLSPASRKAYEACLDPDISYDKLERLISQDASLAATVLQNANTVRYSGAKHVETVGDAISRVGLQGLRDILMVASAQRLLRIPGSEWRTERLQARGPAVGHCARQVATILGVDGEACFVAGLLHDLGWPAAYEAGRRLKRALPREIVETEGGLLQLAAFSHESVGSRLATRWNLSPRTVTAIGAHHRPREAPAQHREAAWVVAAAMKLVDSVNWYPETMVTAILDEPIIGQIGLSPRDVGTITQTLRRDLELNAQEVDVA